MRTAVAGWAVGDHLATAKPGMGECLVQVFPCSEAPVSRANSFRSTDPEGKDRALQG